MELTPELLSNEQRKSTLRADALRRQTAFGTVVEPSQSGIH